VLKAVIFDVDGTLIDSVDLHAASWQQAFAKFANRQIPFERIRSQIGKGGDQLMPVFLSPGEIDRFGEELEKYRAELFKREYLQRVRAFPGTRALCERIREDGKWIAIASSAKKDELERYERIAGIEDLVDVETSSDDVDKSKPHPDVFEVALERLGVEPGEAIAVGDTPYDVEAAARAGLATIALLCGGFPEADLRNVGCIAVYRDPADLLERYDESPLRS
jgi:HAD superfamily hydrolase (TIGR01509 family)